VSELSERCWELANSIMDGIESGRIVHKSQKTNKSKYLLGQTAFDCLTKKDPVKDEEEIHQILSEYDSGVLPKAKQSRQQGTCTYTQVYMYKLITNFMNIFTNH